MKATGIVRRIDDLGRIVVPKEIRRVLRIREGEPLLTTLIESVNADKSSVYRAFSIGQNKQFEEIYRNLFILSIIDFIERLESKPKKFIKQ